MDKEEKIRILEKIHYRVMDNKPINIELTVKLEKLIYELGGSLYSSIDKKKEKERVKNEAYLTFERRIEVEDEDLSYNFNI